MARSLGATEVVDARTASVTDVEPPGVLLECSGFPSAISEGPGAGRAVLVGMGATRCRCRFRYANTRPTAIAVVAAGRVDLDRPVTGHYAPADAEAPDGEP